MRSTGNLILILGVIPAWGTGDSDRVTKIIRNVDDKPLSVVVPGLDTVEILAEWDHDSVPFVQ
jgi:hypothetical protein